MSKATKDRPYFRIADLAVIALVLIVAATGFIIWRLNLDSGSPAYAQVRVNNKIVETVDLRNLNEPETHSIQGNFNVEIEFSRHGVRFLHSDCPDKLCIHSGLIKSGQSAACLPAGVSVSVKSASSSAEVDGVVG